MGTELAKKFTSEVKIRTKFSSDFQKIAENKIPTIKKVQQSSNAKENRFASKDPKLLHHLVKCKNHSHIHQSKHSHLNQSS